MILLKQQYSKIWPVLIVEVYHFYMSVIHFFQKIETLES